MIKMMLRKMEEARIICDKGYESHHDAFIVLPYDIDGKFQKTFHLCIQLWKDFHFLRRMSLRVLIFNEDGDWRKTLRPLWCRGGFLAFLAGIAPWDCRRRNMRQVLSAYRRQIGLSFAAAALLGVCALFLAGELRLTGALFAGEAAAALYFAQLAQRLVRAARLGAAGTSQVQIGLVLMLVLIGAVLWAATTAGVSYFFAAVGGFLLLHAVMMGQLIVRTIRADRRNR